MKYSVYLPKDYSPDRSTQWPLILFLHGAGERGDDIKLLKSTGLPNILETTDIPFIVISPQCPKEAHWETDTLDKLLDTVERKYQVDKDRIYLTGISMGGFAVWNFSIKYPKRFAAIAPICGGGNPELAYKIKHLPVWAFHGAEDRVIPPDRSVKMVEALKTCGGNVRFTLYPNTEHDCWTKTYNNPELYKWFLQHMKHPAV